jgi:capsule polysaccharide export protein KpsE/RkpR
MMMRLVLIAIALATTLAGQPPVKTARELSAELTVLNDRYAIASARFTQSHPDVVTLKDRIALVRKDLEQRLDAELSMLNDQYAASRLRYTESHPTNVRLAEEIKWHEQELQRLRPEPKAK